MYSLEHSIFAPSTVSVPPVQLCCCSSPSSCSLMLYLDFHHSAFARAVRAHAPPARMHRMRVEKS
jgi:hypothetical protein